MKHTVSLIALCLAMPFAQAQTTCAPSAVRIDYEAYMPNHVVAMAPRSEVKRAFPAVDGITQRTVYVTPQQRVSIERGQGLRMQMAAPPARATGVHLGDGKGHVIEWVGYEQVPLLFQQIETRADKLTYNSFTGKARRTRLQAPDRDLHSFLGFLESDLVDLGERTYAGLRCRAKYPPKLGKESEVCVANIHGWPVALYLQMPGAELNWYRATRIAYGVCASGAEAKLPAGVAIKDAPQVDESEEPDTDEDDTQ